MTTVGSEWDVVGRTVTRADVSKVRKATVPTLARRIAALDWDSLRRSLDEDGFVTTPPLLTPAECDGLIALYPRDERFRSTVVMTRHAFGSGEYRYLAYPLPRLVQSLRRQLYAQLAPLANGWAQALGGKRDFPTDLDDYLARCHATGQTRSTPLLLRYRTGDYNRLHQDLYGELAFPLQAAFCLSRRGQSFEGGESLLVEQRPRMQSRGDAIALDQGEMLIFANRDRPVQGKRGFYRATMRHGVSRLRAGERYALGIIFHDAA